MTGWRECRSNDETWAAYRAGLGTTPVSVALGRLVEREVASHRRRTALDAEGVREAVHEARSVAERAREPDPEARARASRRPRAALTSAHAALSVRTGRYVHRPFA